MKHDDAKNYALLIDRMQEETIHELMFEAYTGDVKIKYKVRGQEQGKKYLPSGKVVERIRDFGTNKIGRKVDTIELPMKTRLKGPALYGDAWVEKTGEEPGYKWFRGHLNLINYVVQQEKGYMSDFREEDIYHRIRDSEQDIKLWFIEQLNAEMTAANYEGSSTGVTTGLDNSPNGIGLNKILHPNLYWNAVVPADGTGAITAIGTEFKNTLVSELNALTYGNLKKISVRFLMKLKVKLSRNKFPKAVQYQGKWLWLMVVGEEEIFELNLDEIFRKTAHAAYSGKELEHPLYIKPDVWIFGNFMIVVNDLFARKWDVDYSTFAGSNGYRELATFTAQKDNNIINILGPSSLSLQVEKSVDMKPYVSEYNAGAIKELTMRKICGNSRLEYPDKADEDSYFTANYAADTVLGTAYNVYNRASMQIMVAPMA